MIKSSACAARDSMQFPCGGRPLVSNRAWLAIRPSLCESLPAGLAPADEVGRSLSWARPAQAPHRTRAPTRDPIGRLACRIHP